MVIVNNLEKEKTMNTISKQEFLNILEEFDNQIFSVKFTKKDGSIRDMNARLGVKKYVTGVGMAYNPADYDLITAFDMQKHAYRMINIKTLISAKINGNEYQIEGDK